MNSLSMNNVTICLNMIVKNESKIILRTLNSVIDLIDSYCICDTGSTDNTIENIESYFNTHNKNNPNKIITGKIICEPFINFSHNRNIALQNCQNMADYILLLDADMIAEINYNKFNKQNLTNFDYIYILQGSNNFYYKNIRIIKNTHIQNFKYIGVTHEYLNVSNNNNIFITFDKNIFFIEDVGDGSNKTDKFQRDINLLTNALNEEPMNARYYFYLANSYFDIGNYDEAIKNYQKRIELNGWEEEIWYSYYRIALCHKKINTNVEKYIYYLLEAFNYNPKRLESLNELINYYRINKKNKIAMHFYNIAINILQNINTNINLKNDFLFLENDVYTYKLFYEYSIIAYYNKINNINNEIISILNNSNNQIINQNLLSNIKFYHNKLIPTKVLNFNESINYLGIQFNSSSSCLIKNNNCNNSTEYIMNVRYVNYSYNSLTGEFNNNHKKIITLNKCFILNSNFCIINEYIFDINLNDEIMENTTQSSYIGIEDIRIFDVNNKLLFIGTTSNELNKLEISYGNYDYLNCSMIPKQLTQNFANTNCEKNWIFTKYNNEICIIYKWFPLTVCSLDFQNIKIIQQFDMPLFFSHMRGSTCSFNYEDKQELWFITHLVSYERPRHYYHCIVVLDYNLKLLRYSAPFKFDNEAIEYCLSIIIENETVLINYSTWDKTTNIGFYDKAYIETLLIY